GFPLIRWSPPGRSRVAAPAAVRRGWRLGAARWRYARPRPGGPVAAGRRRPRAYPDRGLPGVAGAGAGPVVRGLPRAVAMVGERPARVLVVDPGVLRRGLPRPAAAGAQRRADARRALVPGSHSQLRRAGAAGARE